MPAHSLTSLPVAAARERAWRFIGAGTPMRDLVRAFAWEDTPLGPVNEWSSSLRNTVGIVLHSVHPMFLWWGGRLTQIYNDAYVPCFGDGKHPAALGQDGRVCWPEIWSIIGPQIDEVRNGGEARWYADNLVPIWRNGRIEDVYWSYTYTPVFDDMTRSAACWWCAPRPRRRCWPSAGVTRWTCWRGACWPAAVNRMCATAWRWRRATIPTMCRRWNCGAARPPLPVRSGRGRRAGDTRRRAATVRRPGVGVPRLAAAAAGRRLPSVPGTVHRRRVRHAEPAGKRPRAGRGDGRERAPEPRPEPVVAHQG
jgi:hypothetical protein